MTQGAPTTGRHRPAPALLRLWVPGRPRPKGSLKPVGNRYRRGPVALVEGGVEIDAWMVTLRNAVQLAVSEPCAPADKGAVWIRSTEEWRRLVAAPHPGAVRVEATFLFNPTPGDLRDDVRHATARAHGDLDKLCRALGDALQQAGAIADDNQIVEWDASKGLVTDGAAQGVNFAVWSV